MLSAHGLGAAETMLPGPWDDGEEKTGEARWFGGLACGMLVFGWQKSCEGLYLGHWGCGGFR